MKPERRILLDLLFRNISRELVQFGKQAVVGGLVRVLRISTRRNGAVGEDTKNSLARPVGTDDADVHHILRRRIAVKNLGLKQGIRQLSVLGPLSVRAET